jgi:DNA repair/transcription protein MET18/MMS19
LFATLVEALTPRLVAIAFPSLSSPGGDEEDLELPAAYLHALLPAIKRAVAGKVDEGHVDVAGYADSLVPVLYGLCVHAALHDGGGPATGARVVGVVGDIIGLVVQSLAST